MAIGYSLSNWTALTNFVDDGRIDEHNNTAGHIHEFEFANANYVAQEPNSELPDDALDEEGVTLREALGRSRSFRYIYDYGVGVRQSHLERGGARDKDAVHLTIGGRDDKRQEDEAAVQRGAEGAGAG